MLKRNPENGHWLGSGAPFVLRGRRWIRYAAQLAILSSAWSECVKGRSRKHSDASESTRRHFAKRIFDLELLFSHPGHAERESCQAAGLTMRVNLLRRPVFAEQPSQEKHSQLTVTSASELLPLLQLKNPVHAYSATADFSLSSDLLNKRVRREGKVWAWQ
jgi:hypothetical protein